MLFQSFLSAISASLAFYHFCHNLSNLNTNVCMHDTKPPYWSKQKINNFKNVSTYKLQRENVLDQLPRPFFKDLLTAPPYMGITVFSTSVLQKEESHCEWTAFEPFSRSCTNYFWTITTTLEVTPKIPRMCLSNKSAEPVERQDPLSVREMNSFSSVNVESKNSKNKNGLFHNNYLLKAVYCSLIMEKENEMKLEYP